MDFAATLRKTDVPVEQPFVHSPEDRYQPFALTDVQQAYTVGRQPGFATGGVGSHFFVEFEIADLDLTRLETVWNRLIARHDMLRAIVRDGQQQVLEQTPPVIPAHTSIRLKRRCGCAKTGASGTQPRSVAGIRSPGRIRGRDACPPVAVSG